jgi:Mn2+/Fe2+ NRAMP family transporter
VLAFIVKLTSSKSLLGDHASTRWLRLVGGGSVAALAILNVGIVVVNILGLAA